MTFERLQLTDGHVLRRLLTTSASGTVAAPGVQLGRPDDGMLLDGRRGLLLLPFGAGSEDDTFTMSLYGAWSADPPADNTSGRPMSIPLKLYDLTVTLGAVTGLANGLVGTSDRLAKAIAVTASAYAGALEGVYGVAAAAAVGATVGGDSVAVLAVPDCFNHMGLYAGLAGIGGGGTQATAGNALYTPQT